MRYRLRTLLILMAFLAISLGGMAWEWRRNEGHLNWFYQCAVIVSVSPFWVPAVFAAYAIGRGQMTVFFICCFAAAELAAVYVVLWLEGVATP
jgi:hypothetical protein